MAPVIRIDDEVMSKLKEQAVALNLVFGTPNEVLRVILGLDEKETVIVEPSGNAIEIILNKIHSAKIWGLIPIPRQKRSFFPGYKVDFELVTDAGIVTTHITSENGEPPIGDPKSGKCIQTGLRPWFRKHPELKDGAKLRIEALEPGKRYKLLIVSSS